MEKIAIYAGSFDPITIGHLDIIQRGVKLADSLIIAVGENVRKKYLFPLEKRVELIEKSVSELGLSQFVKVKPFDGLLVDFAQKESATILIRGLRAFTDFDYEYQLALANQDICGRIETIFLIAKKNNIAINSSLVKEIAYFDGDISKYVSKYVIDAFKEIKNR
ncbi:pantetheine-phosphate adenylyltransferase [bacterium]|nr:pantetheine-phosphate adenylyltransferase [bacterium]